MQQPRKPKTPVIRRLLRAVPYAEALTAPLRALPGGVGRIGNTTTAVNTAIQAGTGVAVAAQSGNKQALAMSTLNLAIPVLGVAGSMGAAWATAAIPIVGPIIAGATLGLGLLFNRKGGRQKTAATAIVNEAEPLLAQNRDGYLQERTPEAYQRAVQNFNEVWAQVVELCSNPELGSAGQRCISERGRNGRPPWGKNWFELYLDPITEAPPINPSKWLTLEGNPTTTPGQAAYEVITDEQGREHVVVRGSNTASSSIVMLGLVGIAALIIFSGGD